MPDPKLLTAMEEIKAVLKKHDVAGIVLLGSQTHMEYLFEFSPSWSCVRIEPGGLLRARAKREDFASPEEHKKVLQDSIGMLAGFDDVLRHSQGAISNVIRLVGQQVPFDHMSRHEPRRGGPDDLW